MKDVIAELERALEEKDNQDWVSFGTPKMRLWEYYVIEAIRLLRMMDGEMRNQISTEEEGGLGRPMTNYDADFTRKKEDEDDEQVDTRMQSM